MSQPVPPAGPAPRSFRQRLKHFLSRLPIGQTTGAAGLMALSAASFLALYNTTGDPNIALASSVGSNVLAGVLQQGLYELLNDPTADEVDQVNRLAQRLSLEAQKQPDLLKEMGAFLDGLSALEVAEELARENPAQSWLLLSIRHTLGQYGAEFDKLNQKLDRLLDRQAASTPPALHQLPAPPADFTGREAQLAELRTHLGAQSAAQGALISGMGGCGKTALALQLAQELAPRYPDAQFFLDLKGTSRPPRPPAEVMAEVLHVYDPAARLPETEAALAPLYRAALQGKKALLLLDNAWNAAQVAPLLPPPGYLLLVTTRQLFVLPGFYKLDLHPLPQEEAWALLSKISPGMEQAELAEIAALCGYLPLALRLAGSTLATRPDLTPPGYIRRLQDEHKRLATLDRGAALSATDLPIEASLALSYDLLPAPLQAQWAQLSVFPGSFDAQGAAAVWELEGDEAQDTLGDLLGYSLVDGQAGRYRLHDLARLYAAARLAPAAEAPARLRHAAHYETVARATSDLYLQGGASLLQGLALFDREWPNIQAGQAWAAAHTAADPAAAALCNTYPDAGLYCLFLRQHPRQQIAWLEAALAAARQLRNRSMEGVHLGNLGYAYNDLGEYRRAIEFYEQRLAIAREIGDRRGEGAALGNLGLAYAALGETRRAIEFYEQDLAIAREIGDRRGEGAVLGNLGLAYADLGETRRAIEYHEQALVIDREIGDRRGEGAVLGNLGLAYADLGETRRAIEFYEQYLAIAREIGDRRGEGAALGETRRAIEFYEQALVIDREDRRPARRRRRPGQPGHRLQEPGGDAPRHRVLRAGAGH
ncbi:MAG: tetratricopeptide repeat protein [Chloroflexi bacterium]|nr:tetratricopeptide repeat protein [Chloroflexota bacterium]